MIRIYISENWYGLLRNDELVAVAEFSQPPTIFDFNICMISTSAYEIVWLNPPTLRDACE